MNYLICHFLSLKVKLHVYMKCVLLRKYFFNPNFDKRIHHLVSTWTGVSMVAVVHSCNLICKNSYTREILNYDSCAGI